MTGQGSLTKEEEEMLGRVEGGEQLLASEKAAWVKLLQVRSPDCMCILTHRGHARVCLCVCMLLPCLDDAPANQLTKCIFYFTAHPLTPTTIPNNTNYR